MSNVDAISKMNVLRVKALNTRKKTVFCRMNKNYLDIQNTIRIRNDIYICVFNYSWYFYKEL